VNTVVAGVTQPITNALDLTLTYTWAASSNTQPLIFQNGTRPTLATGSQYPDVRSLFLSSSISAGPGRAR
jgi:hypothetical protein